jgi:hypothetical protein
MKEHASTFQEKGGVGVLVCDGSNPRLCYLFGIDESLSDIWHVSDVVGALLVHEGIQRLQLDTCEFVLV